LEFPYMSQMTWFEGKEKRFEFEFPTKPSSYSNKVL
jgi:hypothetical protein